MKKLLCAILASLLLTTAFVSCNKNDSADSEKNTEEGTVALSTDMDWESIYADTILAYIQLIKDRMLEPDCYDFNCPTEIDEEIKLALLSLYSNYGEATDGYCISDINGDGVPELIFLSSHYWVEGLFTYVDGKVKSVKEFGHNGNGGAIDKYGNIYDSRCGRFLSWFESIQVLESNGELRDILYYGVSGSENLDENEFYKKEDGEYLPATKEEIEAFRKQYNQYGTPGVGDDWINMTKEHLTFTPFYTENEINEIIISIFEDVFSCKRQVIWNHNYEFFGYCTGYSKYVWQCQNEVAYIDFDRDGIIEALVQSDANGEFFLRYSLNYNHINAIFISPRGGYVYFANGEFCHNYEYDTKRYRITEFYSNSFKTETVEYTNTAPNREKPNWLKIDIPKPEILTE